MTSVLLYYIKIFNVGKKVGIDFVLYTPSCIYLCLCTHNF